MGFKAINDKEKSQPAEAGETQEAREARIIKTYESALHLIARGSIPQAMVRLPVTLAVSGLFRNGTGSSSRASLCQGTFFMLCDCS